MKYLNNKRKNILLTILVSIICFAIIINSNALEGVGMAAIVIVWLPLVIGVITIVLYLITTLITKKYAPILTLLGNSFNLFFAISAN